MTMLAELKFTEARNGLTSVIDRVQNLAPIVIRPRKQSEKPTFIFNEVYVHQLLNGYRFELKALPEDDGSTTIALDILELYSNGKTTDEAVDSLVEEMVMYAQQYIENPTRYFNAPNRRDHLPYILKIMICNNADEVKQILLKDAEL